MWILPVGVDVQLRRSELWGVQGKSKMWKESVETFAEQGSYISSWGYYPQAAADVRALILCDIV
jgi:hypothetical protein